MSDIAIIAWRSPHLWLAVTARVLAVSTLAVCVGCGRSESGDRTTYTLYRTSAISSPTPELMRTHVATFDADHGEDYNRENCEIARMLFQGQRDVAVQFYCEKGRYRP